MLIYKYEIKFVYIYIDIIHVYICCVNIIYVCMYIYKCTYFQMRFSYFVFVSIRASVNITSSHALVTIL